MRQSSQGSGLYGYRELVTRLGGNPEALMQQFGIESGWQPRSDLWVPPQQLIYLYEFSAEQLGRPDFGLLMASQSDFNSLGALAVAMQNSHTVEEAQRLAVRYMNMQTTVAKFALHTGPEESRFELNLELPGTPPGSIPQMEDFAMGFTHRQLRMLSGANFQVLGVELRHAALCPESVYREFFGADVRYNRPCSCLTLATATMKSPLHDSSDTLRRMAMDYLAIDNPTPTTRFSDRVELAIRRSLGTDSCNRDAIASALAVHPRTLQRRLKQEGKSFNGLLDQVRAKLARYYLCETDLPLAQISLLLGYAEQSIFSRRCRHICTQLTSLT